MTALSPYAAWYRTRDSDTANGRIPHLLGFEHGGSLTPATEHFMQTGSVLPLPGINTQRHTVLAGFVLLYGAEGFFQHLCQLGLVQSLPFLELLNSPPDG